MDLGEWTGQLIAEIEAPEKSAYRAWRLGAYTPPRGESWMQFRGRVDAGLRQVLDESLGDAVVVTQRCDPGCLRHPRRSASASLSPIAPAAITIFDIDQSTMPQKARLAAFNFTPNETAPV
jgi:probable phosphoglycerate mutase